MEFIIYFAYMMLCMGAVFGINLLIIVLVGRRINKTNRK